MSITKENEQGSLQHKVQDAINFLMGVAEAHDASCVILYCKNDNSTNPDIRFTGIPMVVAGLCELTKMKLQMSQVKKHQEAKNEDHLTDPDLE